MLVLTGVEKVKKICLLEMDELCCLIPNCPWFGEYTFIPWINDFTFNPSDGKSFFILYIKLKLLSLGLTMGEAIEVEPN